MASLDTNVLVRWLVDDTPAQSRQIEALFKAAQKRGETFFVPITVVLELEWVLRSRYGYSRADVFAALNALLDTQELEIQFEAAVEIALQAFDGGSVDFADCLHTGIGLAQQREPLLTFDVKAARLAGARLLAA